MEDLLHHTAERAIRYLRELPERSVAPEPERIVGLERFDGRLPERPADPERVLALLDEVGSPATMASAGRRFFGFVIGGSLPRALAANWLAGGVGPERRTPSRRPRRRPTLEEVALRWLLDSAACRPTGAGFVTGATMANFTALAAARHAVLARAGWDVEADGSRPARRRSRWWSARRCTRRCVKALGLLGLGRARVVRVPVDGQGRMRADALPPSPGRRSSARRRAT